MKKLRGLFRIIFGRTAFVVLFMAIQVGILFGAFRWLEEYMHIVYAISILLSAAVIIYIFNEPINSSFKMAWIVPVLVIPVFGVLLYIFVQMQFQTKLMARRLKKNIGDTAAYLKQDREVQERIREASRRSSHLIDYMKDHAGYPAYGNTHVEYFPLGEDKFEALMRELKAARHFIFMEYFIVERGYMWDSILKVLEEARSVYDNRMTRIPTARLNEEMLPLIEAYPPPATKGKYIKIKYITQLPNTQVPSFVYFANLPQYVKEPYKRFLENKMREKWNLTGTPINIYIRQK